MILVGSDTRRRYWWAAVSNPGGFNPPEPGAPCTCLVWDGEGRWSDALRVELVRRVLAAKCRYVVCGGLTCERWHDLFDEILAAEAGPAGAPTPLVMTTWHAGEAVGEVVEFFVRDAWVEDEEVTAGLVLQIGLDGEAERALKVAVAQQLGASGEGGPTNEVR